MNTNKKIIFKKLFLHNKLNHFYKRLLNDDIITLIIKETNFLPKTVSIRERLYYIENNIIEIKKCKYCNDKLYFNLIPPGFLKTCNSKECKKKNKSNNTKEMHKNFTDEMKIQRNKKISEKNRKSFIEKFGEEKTKEIVEKIRLKNIGRKQSIETKNKRYLTRKNNGNPWHTKETLKKISKSNKITHLSNEYKLKNKITDEIREKLSNTLKSKILNGSFTPNITNRWTHFNIKINGKKFRSSWEAVFWLLNKNCKYEKIRISYYYKNKMYIYIVDFVDYKNKILYEIKPKSLLNDEKNIIKQNAAQEWANNNKYNYVIISDDWFKNNAKKIKYCKYPELKKYMKQFINE